MKGYGNIARRLVSCASPLFLVVVCLTLSCSRSSQDAAKANAEQVQDSSNRHIASQTQQTPGSEKSRGIKGVDTQEKTEAGAGDARNQISGGQSSASSSSQSPPTEFSIQIGHQAVDYVSLSHDEKYLFSSGSSGEREIKAWDFGSGRLIRTCKSSGWGCWFSADGTRYLAATPDGAEIRETVSGRLIRDFADPAAANKRQPRKYPSAMYAMSPDEKLVASTGGTVWHINTGDVAFILERISCEPGVNVTDAAISFSPTGKYIIAGVFLGEKEGHAVGLWDSSNGHCLKLFPMTEPSPMPQNIISSVIINARETWVGAAILYAFTPMPNVQRWDIASGAQLPVCSVREHLGPALAVSPVGDYIASGGKDLAGVSKDGSILLWEASSGKLIRKLGEHLGIRRLFFTEDGQRLVSCGGTSIRLWSVASGTEIRAYDGFPLREICTASFSPDARFLLLGSVETNTRLLDTLTGELIHRSTEPKGVVPTNENNFEYIPSDRIVQSILVTQDGQQALVYAGNDVCSQNILRSMDLRTGTSKWQREFGKNHIANLRLCTDGGSVMWISHPHVISADVHSGSERVIYEIPNRSRGIPYDDGIHLLLIDDENGRLSFRVVDMTTGQIKPVCEGLQALEWSVTLSDDGKYALVMSNDRTAVRQIDLGNGSIVRSYPLSKEYTRLAFSPAGKSIIICTAGVTKVYDSESGAERGSVQGSYLAISRGTKDLLAVFDGKTVCLYDVESGALFFRLVIDVVDGEYLTWTQEGYYRGSEHAVHEMVNVVRGMDVYGVDQFFDRFYNPAMVQAKIMGYKVDAPRLDTMLTNSPPPFVEITSPKTGSDGKIVTAGGSPVASDEVKVTVRALDTGGGVKEIRLFQDGKRLEDVGREVLVQERTFEKTWTVDLIPGDNLLTAAAFSNEMLESEPFELLVPYGKSEKKPDLYFLVVGVNTYANDAYNLKLAHPDAESFGKDLPEHAKTVFGAMHAKQLYDDQATKQGILAALAEIAGQAKPSDVFAFYFAGHGVVLEDTKQFYLATHGVSNLSSAAEPGSLATEGIADQELKDALQKIPALKQVVFLDACHSGTADLVAQAMGASDEVVIKKLSRASGTWVFTAADKQQYALEQTDLGHGLFTYALLKGIAGEADAGARDGYVKLSELETYVADTVQKLATKLNRDQQPKIYKGGDDFSIGTVPTRAPTTPGLKVPAPISPVKPSASSRDVGGSSKTNGTVDSHDLLTTTPASPPKSSTYSEGFFVIGYSTRNQEAATAESLKRNKSKGFQSQVLFSSDWSNLAPGLYIVVYGSYPTASEAKSALAEIRTHVPDAYVKLSGSRRLKAK